jgi:hypothetical protein
VRSDEVVCCVIGRNWRERRVIGTSSLVAVCDTGPAMTLSPVTASAAIATATAAASRLLEGVERRLLVLHLDVNRTLIQVDPAGGKTLDDVLNANVAARVLGQVNLAARTWTPTAGADPSVLSPTLESDQSYYDAFVDDVAYPKPPEMDTLPPAQADALWKEVSAKRREMKHAFTAQGSPGAAYKSHFDGLKHSMMSPDGQPYYLIPSFFNLVNNLSAIDWPFAIVFRTFGHDLPPVLAEYASFVRGDHPHFKPIGPRLEAAAARLAALGNDTLKWCPQGHLHRDAKGLHLVWGATGKCPKASDDACLFYQQQNLAMHQIPLTDFSREVRETMFAAAGDTAAKGVPCAGLVDYYPWWASHAEHQSAGKVFAVERRPDTFEVFFDDNIRHDHPTGRSIVDFRLFTADGATEPSNSIRSFTVAVDPWDAITRENYFLEEAARCMRLQSARNA